MRKQIATLVFMSLIVGLVIGFIGASYFTEPVIEYTEVPVEVIKEVEVERVFIKTVTREVPVFLEVVKEVEVVREIPIKARFFESVEELEGWIESNHGLINAIHIEFNKHDDWNDCEDQADRWQKRALDDGYIVSACPVYNGRVFKTKLFETGYPYHVGLDINRQRFVLLGTCYRGDN